MLTSISLSVVFANATSGSVAYARMRRIDYRAGLLFSMAGIPGSVLGALLTPYLNHKLFDPLLGCALVAGAGVILFLPRVPARTSPAAGARTLVETTGTTHVYSPRLKLGAWLSVGVGFVSSLLGIGGGIVHVPVMAYVLGFPTHVSTATSHFVLMWLSLVAVIVHARGGTLGPALSEAPVSRTRSEPASRIDPVVHFHEKDVVGPRSEQRPPVTAEVEIPDVGHAGAELLPGEIDRRTRAPFPPQHRVAAQ